MTTHIITEQELQNRIGELIKHIENGDDVLIEKDSKPFAIFVPLSEDKPRKRYSGLIRMNNDLNAPPDIRREVSPDASNRKAELKTASVQQLCLLQGLVSWGGDALFDAERIYE